MTWVRLLHRFTLVTLLQSVLFIGLAAQRFGTVRGIVLSSEDDSAIIGANILLKGTVLGTTTIEGGVFTVMRVPVGTYTVLVSRLGYERKALPNMIVRDGEVTELQIQMVPLPIESEGVFVTASKREQSLEEVPMSVSIVDIKTIEGRNSITIDDALRYVPGVNMVQTQVNVRGMSGYSRGIGSRVLLLLDGLPLLTGDTGEITWETIPTLQVERVEVVKGAGSSLYGSSALGGVINVITRDIREGVEGRVRLYTGFYDKPFYDDWRWSDNTRFLTGVSGSYSNREGPRSFLFSAGRTTDDGYRENDFYRRWHAFGKFNYNFSPYKSVTLSLNYLHQKKGSFFWWRNLKEALRSDGEQSLFHVTNTRWNANALFRNFVSENFFYTVKAVYFSSFLQNDSLGVLGTSSRAHTGIVEIQASLVPTRSHSFTFGLVGNYDDIGSGLYGHHADFGVALYFQDEIRTSEHFRLIGGARVDYQRVIGLRSSSQVSPKFGLLYSPDKHTTLRGSAGRGFRAPSVGEIYISSETYAAVVVPNPDLKPEHSWSFEIGGNRLLSDKVLVDAALFWSDFSDLIEGAVSFDPDRNAPVVRFENVTRARIQGAELSVKSDWFRRLVHAEASYTYIWPKDRSENQLLRFRPRHLFYSSTSLKYKSLSFGVDFRYISRVDRIDERLVQLAPIQDGRSRVAIKVVDARTSIDLKSVKIPLIVRLNINNLFQYHYVELMGNVAPIRNFVFSVEGKF